MIIKECKYQCGKRVTYIAKTGEPGSTGYFEVDDNNKLTHVEHTYKVCNTIIKNIKEEQERVAKEQAMHGGGLDKF